MYVRHMRCLAFEYIRVCVVGAGVGGWGWGGANLLESKVSSTYNLYSDCWKIVFKQPCMVPRIFSTTTAIDNRLWKSCYLCRQLCSYINLNLWQMKNERWNLLIGPVHMIYTSAISHRPSQLPSKKWTIYIYIMYRNACIHNMFLCFKSHGHQLMKYDWHKLYAYRCATPILLESVTHNAPYPITETDQLSGYQ